MKYHYLSLYFLFVLLLQNNSTLGQQLPLFNQSSESLNPAFISSSYFKYYTNSTATLNYRNQWIGLKGAPKTILGTFTTWDDENNLLLGGNLIHDETGPTGFTGIYGKVGYGLTLGNDALLTIGVKGGLVQYRVKGEELNFLMPGDIASENIAKLYPDFSLGAMFYFKENYYIGFSVPQIFGLDLKFKDDLKDYRIERVQHFYGILGTRFDLGDGSWIEASSETRYVQNVPLYINGKLSYEYRQMFWISGGGSSSKEINLGVGVIKEVGKNSNVLRVGYTFSNFFQSYGPFYGTVHELGLSVDW